MSRWGGSLELHSHYLPAVRPWAGCLNSLSLSFLVCEMATAMPVPRGDGDSGEVTLGELCRASWHMEVPFLPLFPASFPCPCWECELRGRRLQTVSQILQQHSLNTGSIQTSLSNGDDAVPWSGSRQVPLLAFFQHVPGS